MSAKSAVKMAVNVPYAPRDGRAAAYLDGWFDGRQQQRIVDDIDRLRNAEGSGRWWGFYGLGLVVTYGAVENWPLAAMGLAFAAIGLTTCAGSDHYARQAEAELKAIVDGAA